MTFEAPMALWGLLLIPLALAAYVLAQRRRMRYAVRFTNLDLLANVVHRSPRWRRHVSTFLYLSAMAALLLALARPHATILVPRDEATVILVMDVSGSMDATDVEPTRLVAAREAALTFLDELPGPVRVGLVAFASSAQTLQSPTTDRAAVRSALATLRAQNGTAMGDGLVNALEVLRSEDGAPAETPDEPPAEVPPEDPYAIVLLSDGANTAGTTEPLDAAQQASERGVPVFTIALGTEGGTITVPGARGSAPRTMAVPPDPETLRQIAELTGGLFFSAPSEGDLRAIYEDLGSRVGFTPEDQEVTVLFAGLGLVLIVVGGALAVLWFNRLP
jgi:Ca-activated chloride channel family protein